MSNPERQWLETIWLCQIEQARFHEEYRRDGATYLLRAGQTNRVKIGYTKTLSTRRVVLQTGNPDPLILVALIAGPRLGERACHWQYAGHRLQGEWYKDCESILADLSLMSGLEKDNLVSTAAWRGFWS